MATCSEGENLFCKVADPARSEKTAPFFADERFLRRSRSGALGARGAWPTSNTGSTTSRYYYYLVPQDSERLAEALYESATGRYEKKDYEGARELLDELKALGAAPSLRRRSVPSSSAYIDLARCRFEEADAQLKGFVAKYEPVRDVAKKLTKTSAGSRVCSTRRPAPTRRATVGNRVGRRCARDRRAGAGRRRLRHRDAAAGAARSSDRGAARQHGPLDDMNRTLATTGGVRPNSEGPGSKTRPVVSRARAPKRTACEGSSKSSSTPARLPARSPRHAGRSSTPSSRGCVPRPKETGAARRVGPSEGSIFLAFCEATAPARANCMPPD